MAIIAFSQTLLKEFMTDFLPYARQEISDADKHAVSSALDGDLITRGLQVQAFEEKLAAFCGAKFCVLFSSGSAALYAAFQAADVSSADRFITTPNSFIATTAAGARLGALPHFIDIDPKTANMRLDLLQEKLTEPAPSRGRFVICPVHFAGVCVDMQALDSFIKTPEVVVIEDAAHAIGSYYPNGEKVGSCSHSNMTIFSFHAIKTITTGEGGAVTTNDEKLYTRLKRIRNSGIERQTDKSMWQYEVQELSNNFHMNEMQAALGVSQLARIDEFVAKRRTILSWYRKYLQDVDVTMLASDDSVDDKTAYHLMVVRIDFEKHKTTRDEVMQKLYDAGIGSQYHYIPLYRHPALASSCKDDPDSFVEMERYYKEALSLPLYVRLEEKDVERVCNELKRVF